MYGIVSMFRVGHFVHLLIVEDDDPGSAVALLGPIAHPVARLVGLFAAAVRETPVEDLCDHFAFQREMNEPDRTNGTPVEAL